MQYCVFLIISVCTGVLTPVRVLHDYGDGSGETGCCEQFGPVELRAIDEHVAQVA